MENDRFRQVWQMLGIGFEMLYDSFFILLVSNNQRFLRTQGYQSLSAEQHFTLPWIQNGSLYHHHRRAARPILESARYRHKPAHYKCCTMARTYPHWLARKDSPRPAIDVASTRRRFFCAIAISIAISIAIARRRPREISCIA